MICPTDLAPITDNLRKLATGGDPVAASMVRVHDKYILTPPDQAEEANEKTRKPTDDELGDRWFATAPLTAYGLGEWHRYQGGAWLSIEDETIEAEIKEILLKSKPEGIRPSRNLLASVTELARVEAFRKDAVWDANPDLVFCKNGVLNIWTMVLSPHRPEHYATGILPFDYDPQADAPTWRYFLDSTVPDAADFLQDFAGECLTTDTQYELALWLQGKRGSGKSTCEEGFAIMLGDRVTVLGLADIERSRFSLWDLRGKTLAMASEQPALYIQSSHILNAIISGEPLKIERKFRDPVDIRPHVKVIWAMNEFPRLPSAEDGLFRRVKVIKFPPIPEADQDPRIKEAIKTEATGILNWALEGLRRLRQRGRFEVPSCVKDATEHFRMTNDLTAVFVDECCLTGEQFKTKSSLLYERYKTWCETTGHKPKTSTSIAEDWERLGFEHKKEPAGIFWLGVGIVSEIP